MSLNLRFIVSAFLQVLAAPHHLTLTTSSKLYTWNHLYNLKNAKFTHEAVLLY